MPAILVIMPKVGFSPIAQLLIAGIGVVLDDTLFGYKPVGLLTEKLLDNHMLVIITHVLNDEEWMDTSVKSVDSIARMQDFLPFVLASFLGAGKVLLC